MSPLVRSLLALAALIATAVTTRLPPPPDNNCRVVTLGDDTLSFPVDLPPIYVTPPGQVIDIKNRCPVYCSRGGERIVACNNEPYGGAPLVFEDPDGQLESVDILCTDGCPYGVTVKVTEYCACYVSPASMNTGFH